MGTQSGIRLLDDLELARGLFGRVASDLSLILDRELVIEAVEVGRESRRVAGRNGVHISFKLGIQFRGRIHQGCLLVPLPEAVTLAGYMMMLPDQTVEQERERTELDGPFKEALLEVGKFLAGACDTVLRRLLPEEVSTRSEGCQGVRAGVRPALSYQEGDQLLVARARVRIHAYEPSEFVLMLPAFEDG